MCDKDVNLDQIEFMRSKMMDLADKKGFTHEETLSASQTLDHMLNTYHMEET